jgi:hypothetical protein
LEWFAVGDPPFDLVETPLAAHEVQGAEFIVGSRETSLRALITFLGHALAILASVQ